MPISSLLPYFFYPRRFLLSSHDFLNPLPASFTFLRIPQASCNFLTSLTTSSILSRFSQPSYDFLSRLTFSFTFLRFRQNPFTISSSLFQFPHACFEILNPLPVPPTLLRFSTLLRFLQSFYNSWILRSSSILVIRYRQPSYDFLHSLAISATLFRFPRLYGDIVNPLTTSSTLSRFSYDFLHPFSISLVLFRHPQSSYNLFDHPSYDFLHPLTIFLRFTLPFYDSLFLFRHTQSYSDLFNHPSDDVLNYYHSMSSTLLRVPTSSSVLLRIPQSYSEIPNPLPITSIRLRFTQSSSDVLIPHPMPPTTRLTKSSVL